MIPFTVITSVYKNDNPSFVEHALKSLLVEQTVLPSEIILVIDGAIQPTLQQLLEDTQRQYPTILKLVYLPVNRGLGNAMKLAVESATYSLIARMDSDDISVPDRFEKQLNYFNQHAEVDIVGGQISEFIVEGKTIGKRIVPLQNEQIYDYLRKRCPFNHMTVMFRKEAVQRVGNYQDWHYNEDYYLWIRMALAKCNFGNLPDTLVNVRVGKEMYQRRGGWSYFKSEVGLQKYMYQHKLIGLPRYCYNVLGRFIIQVLMPNKLRGWIFQMLFRK